MKYPPDWEDCRDQPIPVDRVKVPGGWLIRQIVYNDADYILDVKLMFLADKKHTWECE